MSEMSELIFQGGYKNQSGDVKVKLFLVQFKDENNIHIIYSPHLDLSGYGDSPREARKSFEIAFEDLIDYTLKKKTLGKVLESLGWKLKGTRRKPKKLLAPSITSVIKDNEYVSEIFDKYNVNTYHKEVGIPAYA